MRRDSVYEVRLPDEVRSFLATLEAVVTLGAEAINVPLSCLDARGYLPRLVALSTLPFVLVLLILMVATAHAMADDSRDGSITGASLLARAAPWILYMSFLLYPVVTNIAFEAFPTYDFQDGGCWLAADVSIVCYSDAHRRVQTLAVIAIAIYPVGVMFLTLGLLLRARSAILANTETGLTRAIGFLHEAYTPPFFYWECVVSVTSTPSIDCGGVLPFCGSCSFS